MATSAKLDKIFMKKSGAYHSQLDEKIIEKPGNFPLLPIKTKGKLNSKYVQSDNSMDIIDEAITYFKPNLFFKNFDMSIAESDKLLCYLIWYIQHLLLQFNNKTKMECDKLAYNLAIENFALPGDGKFCLGGLVGTLDRNEKENVRQYLTAVRYECGLRLSAEVFAKDAKKADKWWMCFIKRKFLNKTI